MATPSSRSKRGGHHREQSCGPSHVIFLGSSKLQWLGRAIDAALPCRDDGKLAAARRSMIERVQGGASSAWQGEPRSHFEFCTVFAEPLPPSVDALTTRVRTERAADLQRIWACASDDWQAVRQPSGAATSSSVASLTAGVGQLSMSDNPFASPVQLNAFRLLEQALVELSAAGLSSGDVWFLSGVETGLPLDPNARKYGDTLSVSLFGGRRRDDESVVAHLTREVCEEWGVQQADVLAATLRAVLDEQRQQQRRQDSAVWRHCPLHVVGGRVAVAVLDDSDVEVLLLRRMAAGAVARLRAGGQAMVRVCGPLTTGGTGDRHSNEQRLKQAEAVLMARGHAVLDFFNGSNDEHLLAAAGIADWTLIMEHYHGVILASGLISAAYFLPDWQSSRGACWEHDFIARRAPSTRICDFDEAWLTDSNDGDAWLAGFRTRELLRWSEREQSVQLLVERQPPTGSSGTQSIAASSGRAIVKLRRCLLEPDLFASDADACQRLDALLQCLQPAGAYQQNDCFVSMHCLSAAQQPGLVHVSVEYNPSEKRVAAARRGRRVRVRETPELYRRCVAPVALARTPVKWIEHIFDGSAEAERVVHADEQLVLSVSPKVTADATAPAPPPGCELPTYLIAMFKPRPDDHGRALLSVRELDGARHLDALRQARQTIEAVLLARFNTPWNRVRCFFHYPPTFYHLHLHVVHLDRDDTSVDADRAISLDYVIDMLATRPRFFLDDAVLYYLLSENDELYQAITNENQ